MTSNDETIHAYHEKVKEYITSIPTRHNSSHARLITWINTALSHVPEGGKILEIGSATPRDANYMRSKGYTVQCSDATPGFVEHLRQQGENPLILNVLTDPIPRGYSLIIAIAVFPHFTRSELQFILRKIYESLAPGTVFAFNVKHGENEEWVLERFNRRRFMCYWQPEDIRNTTEKAGFEIAYLAHDPIGDLPGHRWITLIAQKPSQ